MKKKTNRRTHFPTVYGQDKIKVLSKTFYYKLSGFSFIEVLTLVIILSSISAYTLQQFTRMKKEIHYTEVKSLHASFITAITVYNMLWQAQSQNALTRDALSKYQSSASEQGFPISPNANGIMKNVDCEFIVLDVLEPAPKVSHITGELDQEAISAIDTGDVHFIALSPDSKTCEYTYVKNKPQSGSMTYRISYSPISGQVLLGQISMP